jgi:hypothetical protein
MLSFLSADYMFQKHTFPEAFKKIGQDDPGIVKALFFRIFKAFSKGCGSFAVI